LRQQVNRGSHGTDDPFGGEKVELRTYSDAG